MRLARHFAELISDIFWSTNMEFGTKQYLSACNIIRIYSKVEDYEIENKTCVDTEYEWEKMTAALTSTRYYYTKSRGRRELGLPTLSAAVL